MIKWNINDFNVEDIIMESKILNALIFNSYRLYGSVDKENAITIGYMTETFPYFNQKVIHLKKFFTNNGLNVKLLLNEDCHWKNKHILRIGLNEYTRDDTKLSSAILKTIIGVSEGNILLTPKQVNKKFDFGF